MLANLLKKAVLRCAPKPAAWLRVVRANRQIRRVEQNLGIPTITSAFIQQHGLSILGGPFRGMKYVSSAAGSVLVPKLLGSYEAELHPALESAIALSPGLVVDVGCAEGYYAVGLARRLPQAQVQAFDLDARARKLCEEMGRANAVENTLSIKIKCDTQNLSSLLESTQDAALIICDCEGYEWDLLDPQQIPSLSKSHIIVELHPDKWPLSPNHDTTSLFLERFAKTHQLTLLTAEARDPQLYPALDFLPAEQQRIAVAELRLAGQQWAFLTAHAATP